MTDLFNNNHAASELRRKQVNAAMFNVAPRPDVHAEIESVMRYSGMSRRSAECIIDYGLSPDAPETPTRADCRETHSDTSPLTTQPRRGISNGRRESFKVFSLLSLGCVVLLAFDLSRHAWGWNGGAHALAAGAVITGLWAVVSWRAR